MAPASAQTGAWTAPVALSGGGQGFEAAAAMDASGNSVAIWDEITGEAHIWSRIRPSAGGWSGPMQVSPASPGLQTSSVFPAVRISAAGFATAVWTDLDGVWTADRPPASDWNPPQLLIPGASGPVFAMNSQGDAAIAWTVGGATDADSSVNAVLRPAGAAWTSPQTIASGGHLMADHAGIGGNGAAIVTWESYSAVCSDGFCQLSNFVPHASRQEAGSGVWADSGTLMGPTDDSHNALIALDSSGRAMLVALSAAGAYVSSTQGASGGAWSPFHTVVNVQEISIVSDLASDNVGNVTMVYEVIGFSTSQALAVSGSIGKNAWLPPVVLSGGDNVFLVYFALAPSGAALTVWATNTATPEVHAVTRAVATGTWSVPVTVSVPGNTETEPEAAAVNSAGKAIVVYSGYNAANLHIEYATNYTP
jgi:hypothetical protein